MEVRGWYQLSLLVIPSLSVFEKEFFVEPAVCHFGWSDLSARCRDLPASFGATDTCHWVQLLGSAGYVNPGLYACVTSASSTEPSLTRIFICVHWISLNQRGFSYFLKMLTSINYSLLFKEIRSFLILMCTAQGHWGLGPRMAVLVSDGIFRRWSLVETL